MGFCNRGVGNVHECSVVDGFVIEELTISKSVYRYKTSLRVNIPKQCNLFVSDSVIFYLKHEGLVYIGRYDGVISIYRESDLLLVGLNNWEAPPPIPRRLIGFYNSVDGQKGIHLDTRDHITVYVDWKNTEAMLDVPMNDTDDLFAHTHRFSRTSHMAMTEGGDVLGISVWNIQGSVWRRNCEIFL